MLLSFFQSSIFSGLLTGIGTIFSFSVAGFIAFKYLFLHGLNLAIFCFIGLALGEVVFLSFFFFNNPETIQTWLYWAPLISLFGFFFSLNSLLQRFRGKPSRFTGFFECFILVLTNPALLFDNVRFFSISEFQTNQDYILFFIGLTFSIFILGLISSIGFSFGSNQLFYSVFSKIDWTQIPLFPTKKAVSLIQFQETFIKVLSSFGIAVVTWSFFQYPASLYPKYYFGNKVPPTHRFRMRTKLKKFKLMKTARAKRRFSVEQQEETIAKMKILAPLFSPVVYNTYSPQNRDQLQPIARSNVRLTEPIWKNGAVRFLKLYPKYDERSEAQKRAIRRADERKAEYNQAELLGLTAPRKPDPYTSFEEKQLRGAKPFEFIYSFKDRELFFKKSYEIKLRERFNPALVTTEPNLLNIKKTLAESSPKLLINKVNFYKDSTQAEIFLKAAKLKPPGSFFFPYAAYLLQVHERFPYTQTIPVKSIPEQALESMVSTKIKGKQKANTIGIKKDYVRAAIALFAADPEAFHFFLYVRDHDARLGNFQNYVHWPARQRLKAKALRPVGMKILDKLSIKENTSFTLPNYQKNNRQEDFDFLPLLVSKEKNFSPTPANLTSKKFAARLKTRVVLRQRFNAKLKALIATYPELALLTLAP